MCVPHMCDPLCLDTMSRTQCPAVAVVSVSLQGECHSDGCLSPHPFSDLRRQLHLRETCLFPLACSRTRVGCQAQRRAPASCPHHAVMASRCSILTSAGSVRQARLYFPQFFQDNGLTSVKSLLQLLSITNISLLTPL